MQHHTQGQQPHTAMILNSDTFYEQQMLMGLSISEKTASENKSSIDRHLLKDT